MKNVTEEFYDNAQVLCGIVKGPKHTVEIHFRFANPWPEGQGYYLKDENGKERRNDGQLWEDFRTALRQAHLVESVYSPTKSRNCSPVLILMHEGYPSYSTFAPSSQRPTPPFSASAVCTRRSSDGRGVSARVAR